MIHVLLVLPKVHLIDSVPLRGNSGEGVGETPAVRRVVSRWQLSLVSPLLGL